jgi:hypothetical protein
MAYDAKRGRMVLFGGFKGGASATIFDETWEYNGTAWTLASPTLSPPGRESAMMTFDTSRGKMILFGGASSTGTLLQDTWEYDGTTWTDLSATNPPAARRDGGMAYMMGARQHVVLFGGGTVSVSYGDTVELIGSAWSTIPGNATPSLRFDTRSRTTPSAVAWSCSVARTEPPKPGSSTTMGYGGSAHRRRARPDARAPRWRSMQRTARS